VYMQVRCVDRVQRLSTICRILFINLAYLLATLATSVGWLIERKLADHRN